MNSWLHEKTDRVSVSVKIVPRSKKSEIVGFEEGRLKIRIAAPPVDDAANKELLRYLAKFFDTSKSQVHIAAGHTARVKRIEIKGLQPADVYRHLENAGFKIGE